MIGPLKQSGDYTPDSNWVQSGAMVAGDAVGTANQVKGVKIDVPRDLIYRRLYCAAFTIPAFSTGYQVGASKDGTFILQIKNNQTEWIKMEWGNDNSPGIAYPTTSGRVQDPGILRPQFRVAVRQQQQPFMTGWSEPMMKDGMEVAFRTVNTTPAPTALEWLVCCAPFDFVASVTEISINADRSILVTPDQLFFWVGCLSSESPLS